MGDLVVHRREIAFHNSRLGIPDKGYETKACPRWGPQEIDGKDPMKRTINRVLARLAMFLIAIILGAIAVAQAQRGFDANRQATAQEVEAGSSEVASLAATTPSPAIPDPESQADYSAGGFTSTTYPEYSSEQPSTDDGQFAAPTPAYASQESPAPPSPYIPETATVQTSFEDPASDFVPAPPAGHAATDGPPMPMPATDSGQYADNGFSSAPSYEGFSAEPEAGSTTIHVREDDAQRDRLVPQPPAPAAQEMTFADRSPAPPTYGNQQPPAYTNEAPTYTPPPSNAQLPNNQLPNNQLPNNQLPNNQLPNNQLPNNQLPNNQLPNAQLPPAQPSAMNNPYLSSGLTQPMTPISPQNTEPVATAVGSGKPGPTELEGPQNPTLTVVKKSPREVQVGMPAKFEIVIRNTGNVEAHDVIVRDQIPHGTQLVGTNPPANQSGDGTLSWPMGSLRPGAEVTVSMEVRPIEEGDIGSVANVTFQAEASSRTVVTRPQLVLEHTAAREVLVGEDVIFNIKLTNTGSGAATNVIIEEDVPDGLQHYDGNRLEYPIGMLRPDESRILELKLKADQAGMVENILFARADGSVATEDRCQLEIVAPQIQVEISGPRRRFLERKANYEIHVANPGTAAAHNVELVARLPRNLKFVNTNNAGRYDSQRHQVIWNLSELPPQEMGTVSLETTPVQIGDDNIQVDVRASTGLADSVEHQVSIDGLAALLYTVTDVSDPIEVGGQTTYEIHIVNQGSKAATNLQLAALIAPGMELINGEGPSRANIDGRRLIFEPLPRLAPQADTFYKIHVKGLQPGDKRITVKLISDEVNEPVTKEESTHVYADE